MTTLAAKPIGMATIALITFQGTKLMDISCFWKQKHKF